MRLHQGSGLLPSFAVAGGGQAVVAHFGKPSRQDMLHESGDKLFRAQRQMLLLLRAVVAITKGDVAVHKGLQAAIGDCHPKRVARQVSQDLFACSSMLTMHNPGLRPRLGRRWLE